MTRETGHGIRVGGYLALITLLILTAANILLLYRTIRLQDTIQDQVLPRNTYFGLESGVQAPPLTLRTSSGDSFETSNLQGRDYLLAFVSAGCEYSESAIDSLISLSSTEDGPEILLIVNGTEADARTMKEKFDIEFPVLIWPDDIRRLYRVPAVPFFTYVQADGTIGASGFADMIDLLSTRISASPEGVSR